MFTAAAAAAPAGAAAPPARTYGMDYILTGQFIAPRDFRAAGIAAAQRPALGKQSRPRSPVDAAVNASASQK